MFCSSLRQRKSLDRVMVQKISAGLGLKEDRLETHDLSIPITSSEAHNGHGHLRVLLLSSDSISEERMAGTLERIDRFHALTGAENAVIVFLLYEERPSAQGRPQQPHSGIDGMSALTRLQAELSSRRLHIPTLLLAKLHDLVSILKDYLSTLSQPRRQPPAAPTAADLLPYCTSGSRLSDWAVGWSTDLFSSLQDLLTPAVAADHGRHHSNLYIDSTQSEGDMYMSPASQDLFLVLGDNIGQEAANGMKTFWRQERLAQ